MKMVKVEVSKLTGTALDWAVAKAVGLTVVHIYRDEFNAVIRCYGFKEHYSPSTNWAHGGPLIDKFKVEHEFNDEGCEAFIYEDDIDLHKAYDSDLHKAYGKADTLLKAVCQAIVMLKLGNEIEVPAVLVKDGE